MSAHVVTIGGVTATVPEHARRGGISRQLLRYRLKIGVPEAELFAPARSLVRHPDEVVTELRLRVAAGETPSTAGRALGMSPSHARNVVDGFYRKRPRRALETSEARP